MLQEKPLPPLCREFIFTESHFINNSLRLDIFRCRMLSAGSVNEIASITPTREGLGINFYRYSKKQRKRRV